MLNFRRKAREWLNGASLPNFREIVREAKIADEDLEILDLKFIHGLSNVQIADRCSCSVEKVNYIIRRSYDKVARLM